jgi:hypothetical protein
MRIKIKIKNIFYFFIEGWNWKEKLIQPKDKKKKTIKRMRIKIWIKNKKKLFYLKGTIKKKNQLNKSTKK